MQERSGSIFLVIAFGVMLGFVAFLLVGPREAGVTANPGTTVTSVSEEDGSVGTAAIASTVEGEDPASTPSTVDTGGRPANTVPASTVSEPWGSITGLTMFRGNPTRTFYGTGPISDSPQVAWTYPEGGMCSESTNLGETTVWCGMGWTGQPAVWERDDGITELIFGAYDRAVHFVNAETGEDTRPRFTTGDIIKGSVTVDPDGYPLVYTGSRDNQLRIIALDRDEPTELWSLDAEAVDGTWNDDWDGNPLIIDDIMYEGGENSWFFAYELNRAYDGSGQVTVEPERLLAIPGYDAELRERAGPNLSIENSVAAFEQRVYFANSAGRVVGLDVSNIRAGEAPVVFDYWAGGDIDASIVIDAEGMLYVSVNVKPGQVAAEYRTQANIDRTREVGQLIKLDPYSDGDPLTWSVNLSSSGGEDSGTWATPALHNDLLYTNTHLGSLIAVDTETGGTVWRDGTVGWHSWSSPAVVDDTLVVATCAGDVRGYSLQNPRAPERLWTVTLGESCLEATPAIWNGSIYLGSRDGYLRAIR
jgi:WD40 repeat protein